MQKAEKTIPEITCEPLPNLTQCRRGSSPCGRSRYRWVLPIGWLFCVFLILSLGYQGCGTATRPSVAVQPGSPPKPTELKPANALDSVSVPAGVDSFVAVSATLLARQVMLGAREDSLARELFRQGEAQRHVGKPLWDLFKKGLTTQQVLIAEDTLRNIELYNQAIAEVEKGSRALGRGDLEGKPEEIRRRVAAHYEKARDFFEQALSYDPWDYRTREELIRTYQDLAELHESLGDIDDAIVIIENYLQLRDESDSNYRAMLGECLALKGDKLGALIQYRWAEDALLSWAPVPLNVDVDTSPTSLDSVEYDLWINIIYLQCQIELDLGLAESALADMYRLKASTRGPGSRDSLYYLWAESKIDWIEWDWGDLDAARAWDQVTLASNRGDWNQARILINQLLPVLDSPDAIYDARRLAAQLDFWKLDQAQTGLEQMRSLVEQQGFAEVNASLDTLLNSHGSEGFARMISDYRSSASPRLKESMDEYGKWCLQYAGDVEAIGDGEKAFVYYYQSALVPWSGQASALFNLAYLSRNQSGKVILYGETALLPGLSEGLSGVERQDLYKLLLLAYRRQNDKPHAEYYYRQLAILQASSSQEEQR